MLRLYLDPRNWPTAIMLVTFRIIHKLFPHPVKLRLCHVGGRLMYRFVHGLRNVMRVNLSICYPDMPPDEREQLVKRNFEQWAISFLEIATSWWSKPEDMPDNITFVGSEHLDQALAADKGVILLGAHFSTLELGSMLVRKHIGQDRPMHIVYRTQKNALFNAHMLRGRLRHVTSCVHSKEGRKIVKLVRSKALLWFAPDHDHGPKNAVFAPFFGHPAATLTTTSTLVEISGAAAILMATYRNEKDGGYTVHFYRPLEDFPSKDPLQDATRINQLIEKAVAVAPEQYMWAHRRFKTQPGLPKAALYERGATLPNNPQGLKR